MVVVSFNSRETGELYSAKPRNNAAEATINIDAMVEPGAAVEITVIPSGYGVRVVYLGETHTTGTLTRWGAKRRAKRMVRRMFEPRSPKRWTVDEDGKWHRQAS